MNRVRKLVCDRPFAYLRSSCSSPWASSPIVLCWAKESNASA